MALIKHKGVFHMLGHTLIWKAEHQTDKDDVASRETLSIEWFSTPNDHNSQSWTMLKPGGKFYQGFPSGCQKPKKLGHIPLCLCFSGELGWKWDSWDWNQHFDMGRQLRKANSLAHCANHNARTRILYKIRIDLSSRQSKGSGAGREQGARKGEDEWSPASRSLRALCFLGMAASAGSSPGWARSSRWCFCFPSLPFLFWVFLASHLRKVSESPQLDNLTHCSLSHNLVIIFMLSCQIKNLKCIAQLNLSFRNSIFLNEDFFCCFTLVFLYICQFWFKVETCITNLEG